MPKVKLGQDPAEELKKRKRSMVRVKMAENNLRQKDVAALCGWSEAKLSSSLKNWAWSLDDAVKLNKVLHFNSEEATLMLQHK